MKNRKGPKQEPWGTPLSVLLCVLNYSALNLHTFTVDRNSGVLYMEI